MAHRSVVVNPYHLIPKKTTDAKIIVKYKAAMQCKDALVILID